VWAAAEDHLIEIRACPLMKIHGYIGLLIVLAAEVLLFSGNRFVGFCFTPIVWTGYVLFIDAVVSKIRGHSLLTSDRTELLIIVVISIGVWWLFELYNNPRFWRADGSIWWHYHNLPRNLSIRRVGYDWAFATILPALFLTAEVIKSTRFIKKPRFDPILFPRTMIYVLVLIGALGVVLPLVYTSPWSVPFVWVSFIFLLDPLNYLRRVPSICEDLAQGDWSRLFSLLASGLVCGVLWEFWNYWAITKWTYTLPIFDDLKIFEMPAIGFLGFPAFAVESWVMYMFLRSLLQPLSLGMNRSFILVRDPSNNSSPYSLGTTLSGK
jgi:hypothetical protein